MCYAAQHSYVPFKHHISAQTEGKQVLAISIVQNFLGEYAPNRPPPLTLQHHKRHHKQRLHRLRPHSLPTNQLESSAFSQLILDLTC